MSHIELDEPFTLSVVGTCSVPVRVLLRGEERSVCKLCLRNCHDWQAFCGAECCAKWEAR